MSGRVWEVLRKRGISARSGVSTAQLCTFRIGGPAAALVEPRCVGELIEAVAVCQQEELPFWVIGKGSNILFDDQGINGVLICTTPLDHVKILSEGRVKALCGASLAAICQQAARAGYSGLEFAAGIPGTLGGGIFMNAGAHGRALSDVIRSVDVLCIHDGKIETVFNQQLNFSYRYSELQSKKDIVLSAELQLVEGALPGDIFSEMKRLCRDRRQRQPLDFPSAGSTFRRPTPTHPLAAELDRLGLKGLRMGGAEVSEKHAGFIVNKGGATASDVRALIVEIQNRVEKELGYRPVPEIRWIPEEV